MLHNLNTLYLTDLYNNWRELVITNLILAVLLIILVFVIKKIIMPVIKGTISKYYSKHAAIVEQNSFYRYLFHIFISLYLIFWNNLFYDMTILPKIIAHVIVSFLAIYTTTSIGFFLISVINIVINIYDNTKKIEYIPINLYAQILKIFTVVLSTLIIFCYLFNISLTVFFTSIGAAAAVLAFIFRDTALGLIASLQLTLQDIIRIGDWVSIPQYSIDGDIESITISVTKVRNFDKTISIIPTYSLLTTNIKNWRGMKEAGGRRIKRAIHIDMNTITFCSGPLIQKLQNVEMIKGNINKIILGMNKCTLEDGISAYNIDHLTNLGLFRYYVNEYLKQHLQVHQNNFTLLVRQLDPTATGLPLEIYLFTKSTDWKIYEDIQSEIFEHLFAVIPFFEMKIFQYYQ